MYCAWIRSTFVFFVCIRAIVGIVPSIFGLQPDPPPHSLTHKGLCTVTASPEGWVPVLFNCSYCGQLTDIDALRPRGRPISPLCRSTIKQSKLFRTRSVPHYDIISLYDCLRHIIDACYRTRPRDINVCVIAHNKCAKIGSPRSSVEYACQRYNGQVSWLLSFLPWIDYAITTPNSDHIWTSSGTRSAIFRTFRVRQWRR